MPKTRLGRWAGWLLVSSVVLLTTLIAAYNTDLLGKVFAQRTPGGLVLWILTALAAVGTLVTAMLSRFRSKDRSPVVIVATVYGVLATILMTLGAMPQV
jgi:hypothetical protein